MLNNEIERIKIIIQAFATIANKSPEYKELCSHCITDLNVVNYNLSVVNKFLEKAKTTLEE